MSDLHALRRVGRVVAVARDTMARCLRPGVSTRELDEVGAAVLERFGAISAPRLAVAFPGSTCISINDEAAHGIPGDREIEPGDLVNIDVSASLDGFFADTGASYPVPPIAPSTRQLVSGAKRALRSALAAMKPGHLVSRTGRAVEAEARHGGLHAIRNLWAHGTGRALWEEPLQIANYFLSSDRRRFGDGQVIAMEVFLAEGTPWVGEAVDGWTLRTLDGSRAAQFEHTVVVTDGGPLILTAA